MNNGIKIRKKIAALNQEVKNVFEANFFILNERILEIQKEITELQLACEHSFVEGMCEYCGKVGEE